MDWAHILTVSKSRCSAVADMQVDKPGGEFIRPVIEWLTSGEYVPVTTPKITMTDLMALYSPEAIMEANNGNIPQTDEEISVVHEKLQQAVTQ
jgi:hypothetical protein